MYRWISSEFITHLIMHFSAELSETTPLSFQILPKGTTPTLNNKKRQKVPFRTWKAPTSTIETNRESLSSTTSPFFIAECFDIRLHTMERKTVGKRAVPALTAYSADMVRIICKHTQRRGSFASVVLQHTNRTPTRSNT